eukprot:CAMPEP_0205801768 /NCGR_PEP_ID=MMETSP0205-20121125/3863_1 /ASSEMBLY_ACC=CAM_ASM_000278 /TAXON_ID=36767 /ORGANISM="Euplotes focardii, Strain TN1" /LENGTH=138 /DNA_ID=CAMNT_0053067059 /DNA_START=149 /DNA_END=562 /DNA_ORIENTATION=-
MAKIQLEKIRELMKTNPDILKYINQDPEIIERELKKDEEYTKLMKSEELDMDKEIRDTLQNWIISYRKRLLDDFENREDVTLSIQDFRQQRIEKMLKKNPKFILRNHLAQECIKKAEEGDFSMIDGLLKVLESPFDEH